ncbi:MAG: peroxidase-related enzyme [Desulfuromusa sp.]
MSRIVTVDPTMVNSQVQEIFAEINAAFGRIPNLFKTYAHHPPLLEANWYKVKRVMMEGVLQRKVKESIAVLVSLDNSCSYCIAAHEGALQSIGISSEEIKIIETDLENADFTQKEKALIRFARKANSSPLQILDEDIGAARTAGATDAEIVEALGVMEVFTAFNRFLDTLQVELG